LDVPVATPVTVPVAEPIVATEAEELVQLPPPVAVESVVVRPVHANRVPVITAGIGLTVTALVETHSISV
jgi:hypothetical protein